MANITLRSEPRGAGSGYFVFEPNTSLRLPSVSQTAVLVLKKKD